MSGEDRSELQAALDAAIEAARAAGDVLRAEFHRPGGPRGEPGKAPVDGEVEVLLRGRLAEGFPRWGFRAEERPDLNRGPEDPQGTSWLIDPNDGTSPFQRGYRGASVSIALIREGRPALGVVYAYAAPDGDGDLLAWAEGCGPLTRNGVQVPPRTWPEALTEAHTVFVSNGADGWPEGNARGVAPARYQPVPGIAYRLARVAGGDGVAASSLFHPRDFDYAAGHALLRGVGATLVDERGREVSYHPERPTQLGFCFGGGPALVQALAQRDWARLLSTARRGRPTTADLVRPAIGALTSDAGRLRRAQGCWLGQLVGDALGSQVEFMDAAEIERAWPDGVREVVGGGPFDLLAGQPTDDSEMALSLARSMVEAGDYDPERAAAAYGRWLASRPFDIGQTTHRAVSAADGGAVACRRAASRESQANGALMRISPVGIAGAGWSASRIVEVARADAALTHPHPVCGDANAVFALALAFAIREGAGPRAVYEYAVARATALGLHADVRETLAAAADGPPADFMTSMGWVRKALQNAFWQLLHTADAAEALVDTVGRGGDTDTNGCIAGALLGAVHGRDAWPARWRDRVLTCRALPGDATRHPRPIDFWPADAMVLAERLLFI